MVPDALAYTAALHTTQVFAGLDPLDEKTENGGRYSYNETIALNAARKVVNKLCSAVRPDGSTFCVLPMKQWKMLMKEFGDRKAFKRWRK